MPSFRYTALGASNGSAAGVIEAPDRPAALRQLVGKGITPASIEQVSDRAAARPAPTKADSSAAPVAAEPAKQAVAAPVRSGFGRRVMTLAETGSFIRELATAVQAGLPLVPALRTLAKSGRSDAQRAMLNHLIEKVEGGDSLAKAAASWGKPFDDLTINLIKAGEASGKLPEVLHQAADLLESDLRLRRSIMSATLYPAILTVLVSIAVVIVVTFIVPQVLKPLQGQKIGLPLPTRMVQGFAAFIGGYWWALIAGIVIAVVAFGRARRQPGPRLSIDRMTLRIPLFGAMIRDATVARFTRTLGTLVSAGLPVLTALRLTADTLTNVAMRGAVRDVCDQVAGGKTIAEPLEKTGFFPPLLVQIVSLGERSGRLPELLRQAAGSLEERTATRVKVVTAVLPPILIVIVACIVGFVVAAIILPLLQLQESLR